MKTLFTIALMVVATFGHSQQIKFIHKAQPDHIIQDGDEYMTLHAVIDTLIDGAVEYVEVASVTIVCDSLGPVFDRKHIRVHGKDTLDAIVEVAKHFDQINKRMNAAEEILRWIKKDGTIKDRKKFEEAIVEWKSHLWIIEW